MTHALCRGAVVGGGRPVQGDGQVRGHIEPVVGYRQVRSELSPQSDDETEVGLTQAADAGPVAWSDVTSSEPVVDYAEPRWRGLLPKS